MLLSQFILANVEPILAEWEAFARGTAPGATMGALALRDGAREILLATVRDMGSAQTPAQRAAKSRGRGETAGGPDAAAAGRPTLDGASETHAADRLGSGFDLMEVMSEYRALRASVLRLWGESGPRPHGRDVDDLTRFNESIDQSLGTAASSYTRRVDQSRDMFLAILGHDLRNPLNSIAMSAAIIPGLGRDDPDAAEYTTRIASNARVMGGMIGDLLDYTRTRLGAGMPVVPVPMDVAGLCRELYDEFRTTHPARQFRFDTAGDAAGAWDPDRLRQAVSNLIGNAVQHGDPDAPVVLSIDGTAADGVTIGVHNGGSPIPPGELSKLFDPLVRGVGAEHRRRNRPGSIGLGLYIAREIARSHGGEVEVTSTAGAGTSFTVRLPRHAAAAAVWPAGLALSPRRDHVSRRPA